MSPAPAAVILLSGGPDSASLAAVAARDERDLRALYLQCGHATDRHESAAADRVAAQLDLPLEIVDISHLIAGLGGQRLLIHSEASILPFGNMIALSIALSYARRVEATTVMTALHADDAAESDEYCRPFLSAFEDAARLAHPRVSIDTPFIDMSKSEVLRAGHQAGIDLSATWSCVRPGEQHCGYCGACRARARGFEEAGLEDRTIYGQPVAALASQISGR